MKQRVVQASRLKRMSKEAFDNLPSGICYFDRNGVVTLCNRQMHRLVFALTGLDLQSLHELETLLEDGGDLFILEDGTAWHFTVEQVRGDDGNVYTQAAAIDVTDLHQKQLELERSNVELEAQGKRLRRLSADVAAVTREEEILSMKIRIHDDIGRSVLATRQLLQQGRPTEELDLSAWKNAIALLNRESEGVRDKDAFGQLAEAAAGIGVEIRLEGSLPANDAVAYLLITAMRECATNAVRHAGGSVLFVRITHILGIARAKITNNGRPPAGPFTEGGGLSSLRARVEKAGGAVWIRWAPTFELTVSVPEQEEGL